MGLYKKILFAGAAMLLAASASLNVYLLSQKKNPLKNASVRKVQKKTSLPERKKAEKNVLRKENMKETPLLFSGIRYDSYSSLLTVEFFTEGELRSPAAGEKIFEITPDVRNLAFAIQGKKVILKGKFEEEKHYRLRFFKGLCDDHGRKLLRDLVVTKKIEKEKESAELSFLANALYLPLRRKKLEFLYRTRGIKGCSFTLAKAFENNLNPYGISHEGRMQTVAEGKIDFSENPDMTVTRSFDAGKYLKERKSGVYLLTLRHPEYSWYDQKCSFILTDLAVQAVLNPKKRTVSVFVRRFSDHLPVAGAKITLLTYKNQTAASGVSGENGSAVLKYLPSFSENDDSIRAVLIHAGEDMTYFELKKENAYENAHPEEDPALPKVLMFADRGVCRPGDSFDVSMFIRECGKNGVSEVFADIPFFCRVLDPDGKILFTKTLKSDAFGYADLSVDLPSSAGVGTYTVECGLFPGSVWGRTHILCAMYVPDRIRVKMDVPEKGSSSISAEVKANFYFGPVLPKGGCSFAVSASPGKYPSYWDKDWTIGASSLFQAHPAVRKKGTLENGKASFLYDGFSEKGGIAFAPVDLHFFCTVSEPGGRAVSAAQTRKFFPTEFFIGLKKNDSENSSLQNKKKILLRLFPAENMGKILLKEDLAISFDLRKVEWRYDLVRKGRIYRYEWRECVEKSLFEIRKIKFPAGENDCEKEYEILLPENLPEGCYELAAFSGKMKTLFRFWHNAGSCQVLSENPAVLILKADADEYYPGQEAALVFESPADGEIFLVSDDFSRSFKIRKGKIKVTFPIPENFEHSLYPVGATLVYPEKGRGLFRKFGVAGIRVNQKLGHGLDVSLTAPAEAEPGKKITLSVSLTDPAGRPCSGTVRICGVDEGVLALTGYTTPDPFRAFYGSFAPAFHFFDVFGMVYPELRILPDGSIGGDGGAFLAMRGKIREEKAARFVLKAIRIPASGKAKAEITLPDFTGALRLMAVACTKTRAGSAEKEIKVRKDLEVMASLPRFAAPGDEFDAVFSLFHRFQEKKKYSFVLELPPSLKSVNGKKLFEGTLEPGKNLLLTVRLCAEKAGDQKLSWKFSAGRRENSSDAVVAVRNPVLKQTVNSLLVLAPGEEKTISLKNTFESGASGKIRLSNSFANGVPAALEWLANYQYDCLEQLSARAFPLVIAPELKKAGLADGNTEELLRHRAQIAVMRYLSMRTGSGGFSMWPGEKNEWTSGTLFAAHFLLSAMERKLIEPDPSVISNLESRLREIASNMSPDSREYSAYACLILSGRKDETAMNSARSILSSCLTDFPSMLAGIALIRGGYASEGVPEVRKAVREKVWLKKGGSLYLQEQASRLGMSLYLLADLDLSFGKELDLLASELAACFRSDSACWGSTQSNAWAVLGLGKWSSMQKGRKFSAEITQNGKKKNVSGKTYSLPIGSEENVTIRNASKGKLFLRISSQGIPRPGVLLPQGNIMISKRFTDQKGNPLKEIRHGDEVFVRLTFITPAASESVMVSDLLPGGLEVEDERLVTRSHVAGGTVTENGPILRRLEKGDDRILIFCDLPEGKSEFVYRTRCVTRGRFVIPPVQAGAMYDADRNGSSDSPGVLEIK